VTSASNTLGSRLRRLAGALVVGALAGHGSAGAADAPPRAVASIPPIHALVAGVMAGLGTPGLLVPAAGSPHGYSLRPSEARMLTEADIVFRIGPAFEAFLDRPLGALASGARIVDLADAPGMALLPARAGGAWPASRDHDGGEHGLARADMHVWLDPHNARAMVAAIAAALSAIDPARADAYQTNEARLDARLVALDGRLGAILAPVHDRPYVVFHDAYQYLERRYRLAAVGAVAVSPGRPPGARRVREIRDRIRTLGARCVFTEPQFEPRLAAILVAGSGSQTGVLDPLGVGLAAGEETYFLLMERLARSLADCLTAE